MSWNSIGEFLAMGGYGLHVWGSFGACALALVVEPWLVGRRARAIVASLRRRTLAERLEQEAS